MDKTKPLEQSALRPWKNSRIGAIAALVLVLPTAWPAPLFAEPPTLPDGPGKAIVETECGRCHALSIVTKADLSPDDWAIVVHSMIHQGAKVPPDQILAVQTYLAQSFPKKGLKASEQSLAKSSKPAQASTDGY